MTDAQHQAHQAIDEKLPDLHRQVAQIVEIFGPISLNGIMKKFKNIHNRSLDKTTASGRVSELANIGVVYVSGKTFDNGSSQSLYEYEPDPALRFRIRQAREDEAFLRWARKGLKDYRDRIPAHVRPWLEGVEKQAGA